MMVKSFFKILIALFVVTTFVACGNNSTATGDKIVILENAKIVTGVDSVALEGASILIRNGRIEAIGKDLYDEHAKFVDLNGRTVMPALMSAHVHVGTLSGTENSPQNFTRENVLRHLEKYAAYGILHVQSMGTDRALLFENGFYDSLKNGLLPGARMLSAGYGFGAPGGAPGFASHEGSDTIRRPKTAAEAVANVKEMQPLGVGMLKMWVQKAGVPAIGKEVFSAIINEAHTQQIQVAAHVYDLADAEKLAAAGLDVFAHSVRDTLVSGRLLADMKAKNIAYIPTLTLDEFAHVYGIAQPAWVNTPFFKNSLEPGVWEQISSPEFAQQQAASLERNEKAFATAMKNVKILKDSGILIGMGTDSGAQPVRTQGFSEHREMELLVQAGLSPYEALRAATINNAKILELDKDFGSLEVGKVADILVLADNPLDNISNTQKIEKVYKAGVEVK